MLLSQSMILSRFTVQLDPLSLHLSPLISPLFPTRRPHRTTLISAQRRSLSTWRSWSSLKGRNRRRALAEEARDIRGSPPTGPSDPSFTFCLSPPSRVCVTLCHLFFVFSSSPGSSIMPCRRRWCSTVVQLCHIYANMLLLHWLAG